MKDLVDVAAGLQQLLTSQGWKFCFIGGLAIQRWSEPRLTEDVDLTLLTGFGGEDAYVDFLLLHYQPRRPDAREFALRNRVLLLKTAEGIGIDVALGALPFEEKAIQRSRMMPFAPGIELRTCSAEDLIVMKAFADRPQDRIDLRNILVRQGTRNLDWPHIREQLQPLCELKEQPEILTHLDQLRKTIASEEPDS